MRPSAIVYPVWAWLACVYLLGVSTQPALAQAKVQITSPQDGAVFRPGDIVHVSVSASGAMFQGVFILTEDPIDPPMPVNFPPYRFSLHIPRDITPGKYMLTASAAIAVGDSVDSETILIDIERPDDPVSMTTFPTQLDMNVGDRSTLQVTGHYADGSKANLNQSTKTTMVSESPRIVTATDSGSVTAVSPGSTVIFVNGLVKVPATVEPFVRILPTNETTMTASETREFVARVSDPKNPPVIWTIDPPGAGTITRRGLYTAPESISSKQTVRLTATNSADPGQFASATVTLSPESWVRITPGWAVIYAGQTRQFTAKMSNVGGGGILWSLEPPSAAQLNQNGSITAPASVTGLQNLALTATAVEKPAVSKTITVWLSGQPFRLFLPERELTVDTGSSASISVAELATDHFPHPVAFTIAGLPAGVESSFAPATLTGTGQTILTLTVGSSVQPGTYPLTITGTDIVPPGLTQSGSVTLRIQQR